MWDLQKKKTEKAVLVGIEYPLSQISGEESLSELYQLAKTAGATVIGKFLQRREHPHNAYYVGSGKVIELREFIEANSINVLIVDDELSPTQESTLEEELKCKVIDRTRLILNIFALHASSSIGKLQVKLAQLRYYLPRLQNIWTEFSRLGGGIGTKGPGEKKIEIDKRIINDRIIFIRKKLEKIKIQGRDRRKERKRNNIKNICLVGYTNSGKSTLMNLMTDSKVKVENKLFATLSPTTRRFSCGKYELLLTDTVGFIRKLPHQVVEAFMATLEQVQEADLLLHIIDLSNNNYRHQIDAVDKVLGELKAMDIPVIRVYNKIDMIDVQQEYDTKNPSTSYLSAIKNKGIDNLLKKIENKLDEGIIKYKLKIPQKRQDIVNSVYKSTCVLNREYDKNDIILECCLNEDTKKMFEKFILE